MNPRRVQVVAQAEIRHIRTMFALGKALALAPNPTDDPSITG